MYTLRIDAALDALASCRERVPPLRDLFRPGSPERNALDEVLGALAQAEVALHFPRPPEA